MHLTWGGLWLLHYSHKTLCCSPRSANPQRGQTGMHRTTEPLLSPMASPPTPTNGISWYKTSTLHHASSKVGWNGIWAFWAPERLWSPGKGGALLPAEGEGKSALFLSADKPQCWLQAELQVQIGVSKTGNLTFW